nr:reverse transcriptase domain-containing protein [Tanacetum cinerariifolium]
RDQSKARKKETPAKDKPAAIYMIQLWQRMTRQKVTQSFERVREITFPPLTTSSGVEGPLVIEAEMGRHIIHRMYVDGGSLIEILYERCFNRLRPEVKNQMVPTTTSLTGFSGETIWPLGKLRLLVTIGDVDHSTRAWMSFMIVRSLSPYNGIIGRPEVSIGGTLSAKGRTELCSILKKNLDIFTWKPLDMTGVPRSVAKHRLNIWEGYSPVRQKKRSQAHERAKAIQAEVQKLVETKIMREVYYHDWLSNPVMVKKHDGSWRMCVDFTDLNKAYPQDCYPLPEIDWKVESLCGYPFKCFLDAYKGYHQIQLAKPDEEKTTFHTGQGIQLAEPDEEKTTFHTGQGVYCYTKMPFGLKNVGARTSGWWTKLLTAKLHLSELPMLVASKPKEELIVYLFATYGAISAVLMTERGVTQTPIYFISRALQGPELNYTPMEKLVMSLVFAAKRLRRYFQAHPIAVITDQPIKKIMSRPDVAGRLQKWSVMLGEHNITYRPRTSVKGQIPTDFLTEIPDENPSAALVAETQQDPWTLLTDGSSCVDVSGAGLLLTSPEGTEFTYALRFQFAASNNEAEYEALIAGLRIATRM